MGLQKDRERIHSRGGYLEVKTNGSWLSVGYTAESKITDNTDIEQHHDENAEFLGLGLGNELITFETSLLQTTKDEIDLIRNNKGAEIQARYKTWLSGISKWQLWALGAVQVDPNLDLAFSTSARKLAFKLYCLKGASTGLYYNIAETANNPPEEADWPDVS